MSEQENMNLEPKANEDVSQKADAPSKDKVKKPAPKQQNFFVRTGKKVVKWFRDLKSEAKKVVWPTGKQVVNNTIIVIVCIIVVAIFVAVLDLGFSFVRDLIAKLVSGS